VVNGRKITQGEREMDSATYEEFLKRKTHYGEYSGFSPVICHDFLFDFQKNLVEWATLKGRSAIFADCGLGKTPMYLAWADNVIRRTNGKVLIVTPLSVSHQTVREGEKFGIECKRSSDGKAKGDITVTNYERLHLFDPGDYIGVVLDESSILKNFDGTRRKIATEFMLKKPYRLLCTATAAPNDYIELGTTSEALGELGYTDMLTRFFKNEQNTIKPMVYRHKGQNFKVIDEHAKWRFKKHAVTPFWKWVSSWARACRKPSDLGFDDGNFTLPDLIENQHVIKNTSPLPGELFVRPAIGLKEQRKELSLTLTERCEMAAQILNSNTTAVAWCHMNAEGDLLEKLIDGAVQVAGSDSDDKKEEILNAFSDGQIRVLVTKPKIAGFGLNWQHCNHTTFFPSHSFEQYYQSIRRFWRFGQSKPVTVDIITTGGGLQVLSNLQKKALAASIMFEELVKYMNDAVKIETGREFIEEMEVPQWL